MTIENKNTEVILRELFQDCMLEKRDLEKQIKKNEDRITELEQCLVSFEEKEDKTCKIFSPRNIENHYKDQIQAIEKEKYDLQNENHSRYIYLNHLLEKIEKIQYLVDMTETTFYKKREMILNIQEMDRQRIARDLHDSSLQNLAHLIHKLELSTKYMDEDILQAKLEIASVSKSLRQIISDIRNTIFDLRPMSFDDLGLKESLERLFLNVKKSSDIMVEYEINILSDWDEFILITIFRIIQECAYNVVQHSNAKKMFVSLKEDMHGIHLFIEDDGTGFDYEKCKKIENKHFGLSIIEERVTLLSGKVSVISAIGEGTKYHIDIPELTKGRK